MRSSSIPSVVKITSTLIKAPKVNMIAKITRDLNISWAYVLNRHNIKNSDNHRVVNYYHMMLNYITKNFSNAMPDKMRFEVNAKKILYLIDSECRVILLLTANCHTVVEVNKRIGINN